MERYYYGFYWGSRRESLETQVLKIFKTIQVLELIDKQLGNWVEPSKKIKLNEITINPIDYKQIYELCVRKLNPKKYLNFDYDYKEITFELLLGFSKDDLVSLLFSIGGEYNSPLLCNSCVIKLPYESNITKLLLIQDNIINIITNLSLIWDCEFGILTSHEFNLRYKLGNEIGFFNFYKEANLLKSRLKEKFEIGYYIDNVFVLKLEGYPC